MRRYHERRDEISNQKKLCYENNREKLLQKQNNRYINYRELLRSYAELQNKLKAMEKNYKLNESEKH